MPENTDNKTVTWASSVPEIASVDQNGLVKGLKKGETTIVVTTQDGRKTAMCHVSVKEYVPVTEIELPEIIPLEVGASCRLKAKVFPENATNKAVTWKSSNESVAKVDQNGVVEILKEGTQTFITATAKEDSNIMVSCQIVVLPKSEVAKINQEAAKHGYITMVTRKDLTEEDKLLLDIRVASESDKNNVWIDLNNNGERDAGEKISVFESKQKYAFTSQTITLYGKVTRLDCDKNILTRLDVSKNVKLTYLDCSKNSFTQLNVTQNKELTYLSCEGNLLTQLNVTNNKKLNYLGCEHNQLTELDISQNKLLTELYCHNNLFTQKAMDNLLDNLPPHIDSEDGADANLIGDEQEPHRQITISQEQKQKAKEKKWRLFIGVGDDSELINP